MTLIQHTNFVEGLRVTPKHLAHLQDTLSQAVQDLRTVIGVGQIGYGLRLTVDGDSVTLSPGLGFAPNGDRLNVAEGAKLAVPDGDGSFQVRLGNTTDVDPMSQFGDTGTIIIATTAIDVADTSDAAPPEMLVVGLVTRVDDELAVEQDPTVFIPPGRHGHTGEHYEDTDGRWRYDGPLLEAGDGDGEVGPPGPAGPPGAVGPQGEAGPQGPEGEAGPAGGPGPVGGPGPAGPPGPQGEAGPRGDVGGPGPAGTTGPAGEVGPAGPGGEPGPAGAPGAPGGPGPRGADGLPGIAGPPGPPGPLGEPGPAGAAGSVGDTGLRGERGAAGEPGTPGEVGPMGRPGPGGERGSAGEPGPQGLRGPLGEPGPAGVPGPQGDTGAAGQRGEPGPAGEPGEPGPAGPRGEPGAPGEQGPPGERGDRGVTGEAGPTGEQGPPGQRGPAGEAGRPGETGVQGPPGTRGPAGQDGEPGAPGEAGEPGAPGAAGERGPQGEPGTQGETGAAGATGPAGERGPQGDTGEAGPQGERGPQGVPGQQGARGATGAQGPPGPNTIEGLTHIVGVNWDPFNAVDGGKAIELLRGLELNFSDVVIAQVPRSALFLTLAVSLTANAAASPTIALRGTVSVEEATIRWSINGADVERIMGALSETSTFLRIELDCGMYIGPDKRPLSSSTSPLVGVDEPLTPGGLMRLFMVTTPKGAPRTFMSRPFARTPATPVVPGLDLSVIARP